MKKNIKNIIIHNPLESYSIKPKQIINTTIINSPKIISSKNPLIIKQYINTTETDKKKKKSFLYHKNIITENKENNFKRKIFNDKIPLIYQKQGINYNSNHNETSNQNETTNQNETSSIMNNTIYMFKRNKNFINNHSSNINNKNNKTNKTNYYINKDINITETQKNNNKVNIESYSYIYPKQKIISLGKKINNLKYEKNLNIKKFDDSIEDFSLDKKEKKNRNNIIINYEIDKEKSKTFEKLNNKKYKKKEDYIEINNKLNNKNETDNNKGVKINQSEISLYIKKYPFQKQIIKNPNIKSDTFETQNTYSNLSKLAINNKIEDENNKTIPRKKEIYNKNNTLDVIKEYNTNIDYKKKIVILDKNKNKNKDKDKDEQNNLIPAFSKIHHNEFGDHLSSPLLDKELKDSDGINRIYSISSIHTLKKNNSLPKTSFRFLINKASKDKQFGESFHKAYERNKDSSIGKNMENIINKNDKNDKNDNDKSETDIKDKNKKNRVIVNEFYEKKVNKNKSYYQLNSNNKIFKKNPIDSINLELVKNKKNNNNIQDDKEKTYIIKNEINEDVKNKNKLSKTSNNFMPSSKNNNNKNLYILRNKSDNNLIKNDIPEKIDEEPIEQNEPSNDFVIISSVEPKQKSSFINIELLYNLENKILALIYKIKKYQKFEEESFDIINYYFKNDISKYIIQLFNGIYYKNIVISYIKTELLSYFLCYDICFSNSFDQIILLIKSIINLIHNNFLLLIIYIIKGNKNKIFNYYRNNMNQTIIYYFENIIKQNISKELNNEEIYDGNLIKMIMANVIEINKYYKLIIEYVYQNDYLNNNEIDNNIKFPYCLKFANNLNNANIKDIINKKKSIIISSFFIETYQLLNNYSIFDLENFFYSFLDRKNRQIYSLNNQFILPKMDNIKYKYTLVLDLDETLIHCDKKSNNGFILLLRPGLIEFLQKMKKIYELILFSFGTSNYVDSIIKVIEKNEKFFEYILDRNHCCIYENGDCIKNLNMLNRDLKNIIIIDDTSNYFKLHKENGICIKPFYGDIENDKNTLLVLGNILDKIFLDANITGDIRISLKKYKQMLAISNVINN